MDLMGQFASQPVALVLAFLLGAVSAASSACCTLPTMGILLGYSGARDAGDRRSAARFAIAFTLGIVLALILVGSIAGFVGNVAQYSLGKYWKIFAGVLAVILGLLTLKLLPFKIPSITSSATNKKRSAAGSFILGIAMGGGVAASSLPCNPGIFIILGAAVIQGPILWAILLLASFAIGFSVPLGAVILGVSLGKTALTSGKAANAVRWISGAILLFAGFYLLIKM